MKKTILTLAAIVGTMAAATVVNAAPVSQSAAQKTALEAAGLKAEQVVFKPIETDIRM